MTNTHNWRALVLDDDHWVGEFIKMRLEASAPGLDVTLRTEPDCSGDFDVYVVDNWFRGTSMANELVREIRRESEHAIVVVLSAQLDRPHLLELASARCDLVCEKTSNSFDRTFAEVAALLAKRTTAQSQRRRGLRDTVVALADLVTQLNRRSESSSAAEGR